MYLAPFPRYGDLLAKNCLFFPPLSHSQASLPRYLVEFRAAVKHEETRVIELSSSEDPMILASVVLTQCQTVTDGRTVGRSDGQTVTQNSMASTALSIASYAAAL